MKTPIVLGFLLCAAAAGCDVEEQELPFGPEPAAVTGTVAASGGTVSSPGGISVRFPSGSLSGSQSVTLTPVQAPTALAASGRVVSTSAWQVSPAGVALGAPAQVDLRLVPGPADSVWLASLVVLTPQGVVEQGETRVDQVTGIASAPVGTLGTVAAVIPPAGAVFSLRGALAPPPSTDLGALLRLLTADSLRVDCGDPGRRCAGLGVEVSQNLLARVENAALVFPRLRGTLRRVGSLVSGDIRVQAPLRVELRSERTAENVMIDEAVQFRVQLPAIFSAVPLRSAGAAGAAAITGTLAVPASGPPIAYIRYDFEIPRATGGNEPATVALSIPLQVFP